MDEVVERLRARGAVLLGLNHVKKRIFRFRCALCGKIVGSDQKMEPMCTGPSWTDDHPPEVMHRLPD